MKKYLVVVDMQNDFIDGSLGTPEARAVVSAVCEKIRQYPADHVIATRDTHQADYLQTSEGKYLPVEHCIHGTWGWEICEEVSSSMPKAHIVDKPTFGSMQLAELLKGLAKEHAPEEGKEAPLEIELAGLCTDICVVTNALLLKTALPDAVIRVDGNCCAGVTPESHRAALLTMKMCQVEVSGL